jgi:hypothetical protein
MSDDELIDKFLGCLEWGLGTADGGRDVASRVLGLEDEPSIEALLGSLVGQRMGTA